ncbi:hypothetical protein Plec18167_001294 [Paecilomyces lecythidis]|uniref:Cytochrome oxidase c assembly-domain-containing protein n=1 Tax=Paecilomyces lecythidis TaxID=3004212 RepID=A0ABR3YEA6_9EURO
MSRSAADATRFTATGPYVNSKAATASATPYKLPEFMAKKKGSGPSSSGPGGKEETPKQRVERLRAEARAARIAASTSRVDTFIERGRGIANKAHKAMIYTLIAASGVCGVLTIYSVVSLTMYNRRQRELWLEKQLQCLQDARLAYANGTATDEQLEILRKEKIGELEKEAKEKEKAERPWNKFKQYVFGGLKTDEVPEGSAASDGNLGVIEALNAKKVEDAKLAESAATTATPATTPNQPGQLDVLAENAESVAKQSARSWKSWFTGR